MSRAAANEVVRCAYCSSVLATQPHDADCPTVTVPERTGLSELARVALELRDLNHRRSMSSVTAWGRAVSRLMVIVDRLDPAELERLAEKAGQG